MPTVTFTIPWVIAAVVLIGMIFLWFYVWLDDRTYEAWNLSDEGWEWAKELSEYLAEAEDEAAFLDSYSDRLYDAYAESQGWIDLRFGSGVNSFRIAGTPQHVLDYLEGNKELVDHS